MWPSESVTRLSEPRASQSCYRQNCSGLQTNRACARGDRRTPESSPAKSAKCHRRSRQVPPTKSAKCYWLCGLTRC